MIKKAIVALGVLALALAGSVAYRFYAPLWDPSAVRGVAAAQSLDADAIERAVRAIIDTGAPYARAQENPEIWVVRSGAAHADAVGGPRALLATRGLRLVDQLGSGLTFEGEGGVKEHWSVQRLTRHYEVLRFASRTEPR